MILSVMKLGAVGVPVTRRAQGMKARGVGDGVDVYLAVLHGLLILPARLSRVQAQIAHGCVGEIRAEGFGVRHGQAQHPGSHIHGGWFRRQNKTKMSFAQLRHGLIAVENRAILIS